ncbi:helix-turn-helix domain-containing protein [Candidatus Soleaferrea massiliensis]|uniref:helix-turn-helix domain-containing protein n=1 Tax=Candidatus Soleaferrea massiliensis TaxID=1470354 RepID=UPI00058BCC9C|nr:helix-turn-helix transcriptional regulator [Candidatus Soleaferrea massiliensis]
MFKLKSSDGSNNLCGKNIEKLRLNMDPPLSQRKLAYKMQVMGYDVDNHVIRRIETGQRFVTDIEIKAFAEALGVSYSDLIDGIDKQN